MGKKSWKGCGREAEEVAGTCARGFGCWCECFPAVRDGWEDKG